MKRIWKYPIKDESLQEIPLPRDAVALTVQTQGGEPMLWALVDNDAPIETRKFAIVGTGWLVPEPIGTYVGTFQLPNGLVFHLFEEPS